MSRRWILLLLVLLPLTLGVATFAVLQHASSKDEGGVIHVPVAPRAASSTQETAAPVEGSIAPVVSEQKGAETSTEESAAPPANAADRPAVPIPAQNDSAEVFGPARFASSMEPPASAIRGSIRVAGLAGGSQSGALAGGGGGAQQSPDNAVDGSPDNALNSDSSSPAEGSNDPASTGPDQGDGSDTDGDFNPPPRDDDTPVADLPPSVIPLDPELYNPLPSGPSDGDYQSPPRVSVPEPATLGLLGLGLLGCAFGRRRR